MFRDSLIESCGRRRDSRRGWAALMSVALQIILLGTLAMFPLYFTEALPKQIMAMFLVAPTPPPAAAAPLGTDGRGPGKPAAAPTPVADGKLRVPTPRDNAVPLTDADAIPDAGPGAVPGGRPDGVPGGIPGGLPGGVPGGVPGGIPNGLMTVALRTVAAPKPATRIAVSEGVAEGMLLRQFKPPYPEIARRAHIQGRVILQAIISKTGTIENLQLIAGHPWLAQAAVDAVRQWRYRPYLLNGQPVEVDTEITVNFQLAGA